MYRTMAARPIELTLVRNIMRNARSHAVQQKKKKNTKYKSNYANCCVNIQRARTTFEAGVLFLLQISRFRMFHTCLHNNAESESVCVCSALPQIIFKYYTLRVAIQSAHECQRILLLCVWLDGCCVFIYYMVYVLCCSMCARLSVRSNCYGNHSGACVRHYATGLRLI